MTIMYTFPSLNAVRFEYTSSGTRTFPELLITLASFTLRHLLAGPSALAVDLEVHTDAATPVNSYEYKLNLNGECSRRTVHNHFLQVYMSADR